MSEQLNQDDCLQVLSDFFERYGDDDRVQVIGGIASAALIDTNSRILPKTNTVKVARDFTLPLLRDNGTRRDVDVFANFSDPDELGQIKQNLSDSVAGQLEVSVFGVRAADKLRTMQRRPFGIQGAWQFVSDRYVNPDKHDEIVKSLFPFVADIDPDSLEPWTVRAPSYEFKIPHPAVLAVNYMNRSISGVRKKDSSKLQILVPRLKAEAPETMEYLISGPAKSQFDLAQIIHSAGVGMDPLNSVLGDDLAVERLTKKQIADSELLDYADLDRTEFEAALGAFAFKAQGLRILESSKKVRTIWQTHFENGAGKRLVGDS